MSREKVQRFAFIETRLMWGMRLTAASLAERFDISRERAQDTIAAYRRLHPDALRRDRGRRCQISGPAFVPRYIRPEIGVFLDYVRGQALQGYYLETDDWAELPFEDATRVTRHRLTGPAVQQVLVALREQRALTIHYRSKRSARMRDISPHHLVFAANRYHVRAFCHLTGHFIDLVLSRISHAQPSPTEWVGDHDDAEWNSYTDLHCVPNPSLPDETREALGVDHGLPPGGIRHLRCRKALAIYVCRELCAVDSSRGLPLWEVTAYPFSS